MMIPFDRALWAMKDLDAEEKARLIAHLLGDIMKEVQS